MAPEAIKTPDDLGPTTPKDLYATSDIRMVMVELGKLQAKIDALQEDNKTHKADFRTILYAIVGSFLLLAGFYTYGYNRLDDKFVELNKSTAIIGAKLDDMMQKPSFAPQPKR